MTLKFFDGLNLPKIFNKALFALRHARLQPQLQSLYNCLAESNAPSTDCKDKILQLTDQIIDDLKHKAPDLAKKRGEIVRCLDSEKTVTSRDAMLCMEDINIAVIHFGIGGLLVENKYTHKETKTLILNAKDGTIAAYEAMYLGFLPKYMQFKRKNLYGIK